MSLIRRFLVLILLLTVSACGSEQPTLEKLDAGDVIVAFGDSLTYGTGANPENESYPAVLAALSNHPVVNAGIPGEVSAEGLERLNKVMTTHQPALVLLCHGGNDLLRKLDEAQLRANLTAMIALIRSFGSQVVMLSVPKPGVFLKPAPLYAEIAEKLSVPIDNETLADIESDTALKSDPIHPNKVGYKQMAEAIYQLLQQQGAL
jgi:lysophospholipase L1-like esterase